MPVAPDPFFTALDISWPATGPFSRSFPRNSLVHCDHCVLNWLSFTTLCLSVALNVKSLTVSFRWLLIMMCYILFRSYAFWNKNWIHWRPSRLNPNLMWWVLIGHLSSCFSPYHLNFYLRNLAPIKSNFYLCDLTYFLVHPLPPGGFVLNLALRTRHGFLNLQFIRTCGFFSLSPPNLFKCELSSRSKTLNSSLEGNTPLVSSQSLLVYSLFCRRNTKSCRKDWLFSVVNFGKPKLVNERTKWQRRSWYALPR